MANVDFSGSRNERCGSRQGRASGSRSARPAAGRSLSDSLQTSFPLAAGMCGGEADHPLSPQELAELVKLFR